MGFEIINKLKKEKGITNAQLAKMSGLTLSTLDKITSGVNKNPKLDTLQAICKALGCRLDDFDDSSEYTKKAPLYSSEAMRIAKMYDGLDVYGKELILAVSEKEQYRVKTQEEEKANLSIPDTSPTDATPIRHYIFPAAAGYASPIEGEDYEVLELSDVPKGADFCITVSGDSMEPYLKDGDLAFVSGTADMEAFDVGVFYLDGDVLIKQFAIDNYRNTYLLSANPKREDANRTIWHTSSSTLICYGKVLLQKKLPAPNYFN